MQTEKETEMMIVFVVSLVILLGLITYRIWNHRYAHKKQKKIRHYLELNELNGVIMLLNELETRWQEIYELGDYCAQMKANVYRLACVSDTGSLPDMEELITRCNQLEKEVAERLSCPGKYFKLREIVVNPSSST